MDALIEPKHENTAVSTSSTAKHHKTLWLSDGNVVLATSTYLFRVHKSVLSMRSGVFKDMFAFPTAEDLDAGANVVVGIVPDLYEGLPVVALTDKGKEVEHLLKVIYEPRYYDIHQDHHSPGKVQALLKLSSKYHFQAIRHEVIDHLSRIYPMTLDKYEAISVDHPMRVRFGNHQELVKPSAGILKSAIEAGVDDLFPSLLYAYARIPFPALRTLIPDTPAGWAALDRIVAGRDKLNEAGLRVMSRVMEMSEHCVVHHMVKDKDREDYEDVAWEHDYCYFFRTVDLGKLSAENFGDMKDTRTCGSCRREFDEVIEDERTGIWDDIPDYFGLGDWGAVRQKMKTWIRNN